MAEITASLVKDLREKTGAGMMDCKSALKETNGDMEAAIDWLRKKQVKGAEFDDAIQLREIDPAARAVPHATPLPHEGMQHKEIRGRIDAAIAQLSPEHRAVILMKEIEDMQYHEIAESLGCSIGTVMSRLFYARKKLQTLLRDVYENV